MTTVMSTTTSISTNYYHYAVRARVFIFYHRCPCRFLDPMAHYPRWISSYNVASEAMQFAYATAVSRNQESLRSIGCIGELTIICHEPGAPKDIGPILLGTKVVYCPNKKRCLRCLEQRGGYVFKWYSPLWHMDYVAAVTKIMREDPHITIWRPGDDEKQWSAMPFEVRSIPRGPSMKQVLLCKSMRCDCYGQHIAPKPGDREFEQWRQLCLRTEDPIDLAI